MSEISIPQALAAATQHHRAGRLQQAEAIYRQVLAIVPNQPDALHLLGMIAHQVGRNDVAADLIGQAIALAPDRADYHCNLGGVWRATGQLDQAVAAYLAAIRLEPNLAEAHYNLANAYSAQGQVDQAIAAYRRAVQCKPTYADAHYNLGNALTEKKQLDQAVAAYRAAIQVKPNFAEAHANLGVVLADQGELDKAISAYRTAIQLKPDYPEAHGNLGVALSTRGQFDEAIAACSRAVQLKPNYAEAYNNLGNAHLGQGRPDEAIAAFRIAIQLDPNLAEAHNNLGRALKEQGQLGEALDLFRKAMALNPHAANIHSNFIYNIHFHPDYDAAAIAQELGRWNRQHAEPLRQTLEPHPNDRDPQRRLRIGYVSADFRSHACACFLAPLLENHDPRQVELFGYAQVSRPDALTSRLQQSFAQYRSTVGLSDQQVARQIREDRIDILVDLMLHTADNRLLVFARKPAPVQVTWLGYPGSTGMNTIDYRLSDPHLDPPGMNESVYSEQTIRLPDSFWCYDPLDGRAIAVNSLPASSNGFVTFGCLNNFCKINDSVLRLWAKVLSAVPSSRLMLLAPEGSCRQRALQLMEPDGLAPARVEFVSRQPRRSYLELYHQIDLGLDSFPYNGHTTSLDSLWMGVPVITIAGGTAIGRAGVCQSMNLNLSDLVAQTPEQYLRIAAALANDRSQLSELRNTLRQRMEQSALMDGRRFAANIEAVYRQMWRRWCG